MKVNTTEICDEIINSGFSLERDCFKNGKLREEYSEIRKKFPFIVRHVKGYQKTLSEYATDFGIDENTLRQSLLYHKSKTQRDKELKLAEQWHYQNFQEDVRIQMLGRVLGYYSNLTGVLDLETYQPISENITFEQIERDYLTIFENGV